MHGADRLQLVTQLGSGGQGDVWEVRDPELPGRRLALKRLRPELLGPDATLRFLREAELLARLRHPGVVTVHAAGRDAQGLFLVTDLVEGLGLDEVVKRGGLTPERAASVMAGVCDAVAALHRAGIVHRDLKPANVLLRPDGQPVLLDFGLAREADGKTLTLTGELIGTPVYMSPEQVKDPRSVDARADVYSLGATLHALLTGRPPFAGPPVKVILDMLDGPSWPACRDPAVDAACRRAMALESGERFASAEALAAALRESQVQPPVRSRRPVALAASVLSLIAAAATLFSLARGTPPEPIAPRVEPIAPVLSSPAATTPVAAPEPPPVAEQFGLPQVVEAGSSDAALVAFLAGGQLVSASRHALMLWSLDPKDGLVPLATRHLPRPICSFCAAQDGARIWVAQETAVVSLALAPGGRELGEPEPSYEPRALAKSEQVTTLAVSPDGRSLAVGLDLGGVYSVAVWDLPAGPERWRSHSERPISAIGFAPDGKRLAVSSRAEGASMALPGEVHRLATDGEVAGKWSEPLPKAAHAVVWTPAGELLTGLAAGTILRLADRAEERLLGPLQAEGLSGMSPSHSTTVRCLVVSPDQRRLYSSSWSPDRPSELRAWDLERLVEVCRPVRTEVPATSLAVSPDGRWLAVGTLRGRIELRRVR